MKNMLSEIRNSLDIEERISDTEDMSIEIIQTEAQRFLKKMEEVGERTVPRRVVG